MGVSCIGVGGGIARYVLQSRLGVRCSPDNEVINGELRDSVPGSKIVARRVANAIQETR